MSATTPQEQILGIVNNHWQSCCVGAAAQLELADLLADGPLHVNVLAERTTTHASSLYRMLGALESTGIFTQTSPRVFGNTPASECLRRNLAGSNWAWIRLTLCSGAPAFEGWRGLMLALQNGRPGFDQITGQGVWQQLQSNPQTQTIFNQAMRDLGLNQSRRGCVVRLEPFPDRRRHRRRNRLAVIQPPRCSSVLPGHSVRSTSGRRRST